MKKYYYLDGPDKKGPFTEEELINFGLDTEILVWAEGFENWKPIKEVESLVNKIPPPTPPDFIHKNEQPKKSKKITYNVLILFTLIVISFAIGYISVDSVKTKYRNELLLRVERIFNGKSLVCDGVNYGVKGELVTIEEIRKRKSDSEDKQWSAISAALEYNKDKKEGIVEKFTCESGGFVFKKLKKVDNGYELEVITSTDMVYTSKNYYRGTVQEAYNASYEYIKEDNLDFFSNGSYELIGNFEYLDNKYFYLGNVEKPSYPHSNYWWSSGEGSVYNDYRKVFYKSEGWYYEIKPRESKIREHFFTISLIGIAVSIVLFVVLLSSNPFKW